MAVPLRFTYSNVARLAVGRPSATRSRRMASLSMQGGGEPSHSAASDVPAACISAYFKTVAARHEFDSKREAVELSLEGSAIFVLAPMPPGPTSSPGNHHPRNDDDTASDETPSLSSTSLLTAAPPRPLLPFDGHRCMAQLGSSRMGHTLLAVPSIASTQEFMRRHGTRLGDGVVMVADRQSSGKGRGGNTWTSPEGCLMFSAGRLLKVPGAQAPFINYVCSLAIVRGIEDAVATVAPLLPTPLDIHIKWPNDIYTSTGLKIGGVLIHTTWATDRFNVVTGIGLNVHNRNPTTCIEEMLLAACSSSSSSHDRRASGGGDAAATAEGALPQMLDRELLLARIVTRLEECFQVFESHGFAPLEASYLRTWLHSGQRVIAHDPDTGGNNNASSGSGGGGGVVDQVGVVPAGGVALTIRGLSVQGFLLAEDDWGRPYELTPDGNSLDMMQGLIRRKVS